MKTLFFLEKAKIWFITSALLLGIGILAITMNIINTGAPFSLGIDFTGGVMLTIEIDTATNEFNSDGKLSEKTRSELSNVIRQFMASQGITNLQLTTIDKYLFSLKFQEIENTSIDILTDQISTHIEGAKVVGTDFIGPSVGQELQSQALTIIGVAILLLLIYITFRFEFWSAVAAVLALLYNVLVVVGMTALLKIEINTAYIAAILTILGYSINDTIVIFDRIRENLKDHNKDELKDIINKSIGQSITRSLYTALTTLATLVSIYLFGGASIKDFALTLIIGISVGTYSSILIASPLLYRFKKLNQ